MENKILSSQEKAKQLTLVNIFEHFHRKYTNNRLISFL